MSGNGQRAQELALLGACVFPISATSKKPAIYGGHGHLDATNDPDQIRAWWDAMPDALIGVAAGASGLACVDVDKGTKRKTVHHPRDNSGNPAWSEDIVTEKNGIQSLTDAGLLELAETGHSYVSGSGTGVHAWFKAPSDLPPACPMPHLPDVDRKSGSSYAIWYGAVPTLAEWSAIPDLPEDFRQGGSVRSASGRVAGVGWEQFEEALTDGDEPDAFRDMHPVTYDGMLSAVGALAHTVANRPATAGTRSTWARFVSEYLASPHSADSWEVLERMQAAAGSLYSGSVAEHTEWVTKRRTISARWSA